MFKIVKKFLSQISGFSTPLLGLSWNAVETVQPADNSTGQLVLTVSECAQILQLTDQVVLDFLESGELGGILVAKEWRVAPSQFIDFLGEKAKTTQLQVFSKQLQNPRTWKKTLDDFPEFKRKLESKVYPEESFGRFLQDALATGEKE